MVEEKEEPCNKRMSMEEGLAAGMASLAKLRQRLRSEGDADKVEPSAKRTPLRPISPVASSPTSLNVLKRKGETILTPSLARPSQRFTTSTPKHSGIIA
ncbi:unnamed protein product [Strongylus vulgaris]|uniref:Uncharacterized protein n=1 Tax=Strongylus vulgaris TaxID=40348 RepID=A0A3P7JLC0_STRVU|nr:unnamed protein product [Strongylus vulgaris]